jgi:opacity protein-like surface antigen
MERSSMAGNTVKESKMKPIAACAIMLVLILSALAALKVDAAWADSGAYQNYGQIGVGVNQFSGDLDEADYDKGIASYATFGRRLGNYLAVEGTLGFFHTDQDFSGSTGVAGYYSREDKLLVGASLATLKGAIPIGPVTVYAGAGVGIYYASLRSEIDTENRGDFHVDEGDTVFGVHLVAGGSYDITRRIFVGAEGLYRWTGDLDIDATARTVPVKLKGDLDGFALTLSAGFRF